MKLNKKDLAAKAVSGDEESMGLLLLVSPSEEIPDGMSPEDYAEQVSCGPDETPEEDVGAVMNLLIDAGLPEEQAMSVGSGIFEALGYY